MLLLILNFSPPRENIQFSRRAKLQILASFTAYIFSAFDGIKSHSTALGILKHFLMQCKETSCW